MFRIYDHIKRRYVYENGEPMLFTTREYAYDWMRYVLANGSQYSVRAA